MRRAALRPVYAFWSFVVCLGIFMTSGGCESSEHSCGCAPAPNDKATAQKPEPAKPTPNFQEPPKDAIVLFDGTDKSNFTRMDGKRCLWKVEDGALVCSPGSGNIRSKQTFGDHKLHIEFRTPYMPDAKKGSQARGNSGVYLQGRYEIQVLDSYDIGRPIQSNDCGALYQLIAPSKNACLPPEKWQSYDITFRAPKWEGKRVAKPGCLTVVHNGITIIDNAEVKGTTPGGFGYRTPNKPGPLMLQDHGNKVAYRNIWAVPLD